MNCSTVASCLLAILLAGAPALAETPCTDIPSAAISHFPTHNNEAGGHVNQHILGEVPPHGLSQDGKTLYGSGHDYEEAWEALRHRHPPLVCSDHLNIGKEAGADVQIQFFSEECTAADRKGICTKHRGVQTNVSSFVFRVVEKDRKKGWILYTSYPHN